MLIHINYKYRVHIIGDFAAYPEPVAQKLRRAIYYTNMDLQPRKAYRYYLQALELAAEHGMDPFSDAIMGVKVQCAAMLEEAGAWSSAVKVLEIMRGDCVGWVEERQQGERQQGETEVEGMSAGDRGKRRRLLEYAIRTSVKLGEIYGNDYVRDEEAAEERLVWAVTAVLKERERREAEGVREGEGDWIADETIGAALECEFPDAPVAIEQGFEFG